MVYVAVGTSCDKVSMIFSDMGEHYPQLNYLSRD